MLKKNVGKLILIGLILSGALISIGSLGEKTYASEQQATEVIAIPDVYLKKALNEKLGQTLTKDITKQQMESFTQLNLSSKGIAQLDGLEYAINLTSLHLSSNKGIKDITPLKNMVQLKELSLWDNQIDNITALKDLEQLTTLEIGLNRIESVTSLKKLIRLSSLSISENKIENIAGLEDLAQLKYLDISFNQIRELDPLKNLLQLEILAFTENQIQKLKPLEYLVNLEYIGGESNQITDITPLVGMDKLNTLRLMHNQVKNITGLEELENLESLELSDNQIKDITPLKNLAKLDFIDLTKNKIEDISVFKHMSNSFYSLALSNNHIIDFNSLRVEKIRNLYIENQTVIIDTSKDSLGNVYVDSPFLYDDSLIQLGKINLSDGGKIKNGKWVWSNLPQNTKQVTVSYEGTAKPWQLTARVTINLIDDTEPLEVQLNDFVIGYGNYLTGSYSGDVTKIRLQVNGINHVAIPVVEGKLKYYAKDKIINITDEVNLIAYDKNNEEIQRFSVSSTPPPKIIINAFTIGKVHYLTGGYDGDVAKIRLLVNGEKYMTVPVVDGKIKYYAKGKIVESTDDVRIVAYDKYGQTVLIQSVTVVANDM
ncbi:leucine-rich repeat domain-containing protein [Listeria rocourtiae]|uniref:immunoglobulin-like domain-containing protein n=1 Tax=Listeria rocourtiae TaxID=647910 RepID=UPI001625EA68|nr:immunoglobulin-like domain-containing protein [Listeria rocourtiae]MBC1604693.1 leucine-rich repeat domain-containing protein [Listeria rocourtiae]